MLATDLQSIVLRSVCDADRAFLLELYGSTREAELAMVPWTGEQKLAFVRMQFEAQDSHYRKHYPTAEFLVIEYEGVRAGRLYLDRREGEYRIVDISLLGPWRNRGIGTALLRKIQEDANASGCKVSIHVEEFNPALRLYERLGFSIAGEHGLYKLMEWKHEMRDER